MDHRIAMRNKPSRIERRRKAPVAGKVFNHFRYPPYKGPEFFSPLSAVLGAMRLESAVMRTSRQLPITRIRSEPPPPFDNEQRRPYDEVEEDDYVPVHDPHHLLDRKD